MPLRLHPPRPGKSPNWTIRGTHHGVSINETSGTTDRAKAAKILAKLKDEIERGAVRKKGEKTFAEAAEQYLDAGGSDRFMLRLIDWFQEKPVRLIDQDAIAEAAKTLYPAVTNATRNRQVYTPTLAVLAHAGLRPVVHRPDGALGEARMMFLKPEQFKRLHEAAKDVDPELATLFLLCCFTGLRLSEALRITVADLWLAESFLYSGKNKNGQPRPVHLPPTLVAALKAHVEGRDESDRVFRFVKNKWLYGRAHRAYKAAKIDPNGEPFHFLRHTYGAWMKRAGADLVATGAWKSKAAAGMYEHFVPSEEAQKSNLLPGADGGKKVKRSRRRKETG